MALYDWFDSEEMYLHSEVELEINGEPVTVKSTRKAIPSDSVKQFVVLVDGTREGSAEVQFFSSVEGLIQEAVLNAFDGDVDDIDAVVDEIIEKFEAKN